MYSYLPCLRTGKRLPPFPGDSSEETSAESGSPTEGDSPPAAEAVIFHEADRIIAAASQVEGGVAEGVAAEATPGSVSAEGVAETIVGQGSAVASEAAVTQQSKEAASNSESSGGGLCVWSPLFKTSWIWDVKLEAGVELILM